MREPEFEKQVQKKMEELGFNPSAKVWENVNNALKKNRRRFPFLWIFLIAAGLTAGSYWGLVQRKTASPHEYVSPANKKTTKKGRDAVLPSNKIGPSTNRNKLSSATGQPVSPAATAAIARLSANHRIPRQPLTDRAATRNAVRSVPSYLPKAVDQILGRLASGRTLGSDFLDSGGVAPRQLEIGLDQHNHLEFGVIDPDALINGRLSPISSNGRMVNTAKKIGEKFQIEWSAGAGLSSIRSSVRNDKLITSAGVTGSYTTVPPMNNGISFYAGAAVNLSLSSRIALTAGMNYHYVSVIVHTGKKLDSIVFVPANGAYALSPSIIASAAYYGGGATHLYVDQFHFAELPLTVSIRLNNSLKTPLYWTGGASISYLVATNALQFDPSTATFYKDNKMFEKMQVNFLTGFALGIHFGKTLLLAGPEVQFGATNLLHYYTNVGEQMVYGGLKILLLRDKR